MNRFYLTNLFYQALLLFTLWFGLVLPAWTATDCTVVTEIPQSQCEALLNFYSNTDGINWIQSDEWGETNTPCSWHGTRCRDGGVIELNLNDNNLTGFIQEDISVINTLEAISLGNNQLSGSIPDLSALKNLWSISLPNNQLTGSIPPLAKLTNLGSIDLNTNKLTGTIPDLSTLTKLHNLKLFLNQLSGPIPDLSNLTDLVDLRLHGNQLTGTIPSIKNLWKLKYFYLGDNKLTGNISAELSTLVNLESINLSGIPLGGTIPNLSKLVNLKRLYLAGNQLEGEIPDLTGLTNLTFIALHTNNLEGPFPQLDTLTNLEELYLYKNQLSGPIPDLSSAIKLKGLNILTNPQLCRDNNVNYGKWQENVDDFSPCPTTTNYVLTVNKNGSGTGKVTGENIDCGSDCTKEFSQSKTVTLTATPDLNSSFAGWSGTCSGTGTCNVIMSQAQNVIATFNLKPFELTVNKNGTGGGKIIGQGINCGSDCNVSNVSQPVTLTAIPDANSSFTGWGEACTGTEDCNVTINANKEVVANFEKKQAPNAVFTATPSKGLAPLDVILDASGSFDFDGNIVKYDWFLNENSIFSLSDDEMVNFSLEDVSSTKNEQIMSLKFDGVNIYTVKLTVTDNDGLTDTVQKKIEVEPRSEPHALILTNSEKLAQLYGVNEADKIMNQLNELAEHSDVQSMVIQVESDPTVAAAYATRGNNYEEKNQANAVAEAIKQLILNHWNTLGNLQYLIIVGDDRVIPFYRIIDGTELLSHIPPDEWTLTDDFYTARTPTKCARCANSETYIPDIASGRLIEKPSQIIGIIDTFLADNLLHIGEAAVTGYDFIQDGAQAHCSTLETVGIPSDCTLIGDNWTSDDFKNQILNSHHDITSINGHSRYDDFGTPSGSVYASDFEGTSTDFSGTLFYTVGCHSGQNVSTGLDLPESFARLRANYIANTGYGWGRKTGIGLSEELMWNLTQELVKSKTTIGNALMNAKQRYFFDNPNFGPYDEKIVTESTLYGLPMFRVTSEATAPLSSAITANKIGTTQEDNGLQKDDYSYTWKESTPVTTASGETFYTLDGSIASDDGEPILPKLTKEVTNSDKSLHGAVFKGCNYEIVNTVPPLQRFKTTTGHLSPVRTFNAPNWYPSTFFQPHTVPLNTRKKETVVATAGQYNPNLGQQRIFSDMKLDLYYHADSSDLVSPKVYLTNGHLEDNTATVVVTTSDMSGIKEVVLAYTDGKDSWNSVNLTNVDGEEWSDEFAATTDTEFFIQSVDNVGNVAVNDNEGRYFNFLQIQFQSFKTLYNVGETAAIELVENPAVSLRTEPVDLWVAIQPATGDLLFITTSSESQFSIEPQPFKLSVPILDTTHTILEMEIPPGIGSEYIFYALYVAEGKNPLVDGLETVARSNLMERTTTVANEVKPQ